MHRLERLNNMFKKIQPQVKPVQKLIEPKKPSIPAVSDRGHDRRMKKKRGRGKEDSEDEEENTSGRTTENTHKPQQQNRFNPSSSNSRGGKPNSERDRQRVPHERGAGGFFGAQKSDRGKQRTQFNGETRPDKGHGERRDNNSQRQQNMQPNLGRNHPPRDSRRERNVNERQQNSVSVRAHNAYVGQNPYSNAQAGNMNNSLSSALN
ncbi:hypothetical protein ANCDUO_19658, partial [Ancylostoma duodenale]